MHFDRSSTLDLDWDSVSAREPCAICGAGAVCRRHAVDRFACCVHEPSDWPLSTGGWLHRLTTGATRARDLRMRAPLAVGGAGT